MQVKKDFILREIAKEYVVVPVGQAAIHFNGMLTLNKSAKLLFEALSEERTKDDLIELLLNTYETTIEQASRDVDQFIDVLSKRNILK